MSNDMAGSEARSRTCKDSGSVLLCAECRVSGDFCGYHGLGREEISLCVACAEQEIDVWTITLAVCESGGVTAPSLKEAIDTVSAIVGEMDYEDGYTIHKKKMSRLQVVTMPEFQGF